MYFFYLVVGVSAQERCNVGSLNLTLTDVGGGVSGALASGAVNVMIWCTCTNSAGDAVEIVRWYNSSGVQLVTVSSRRFVAGFPYYIRAVDSYGDIDNTNVTLVIPSFTQATTYTCGRRINATQVGQPTITVTLTISGELIVSSVT